MTVGHEIIPVISSAAPSLSGRWRTGMCLAAALASSYTGLPGMTGPLLTKRDVQFKLIQRGCVPTFSNPAFIRNCAFVFGHSSQESPSPDLTPSQVITVTASQFSRRNSLPHNFGDRLSSCHYECRLQLLAKRGRMSSNSSAPYLKGAGTSRMATRRNL